MPPKDIKHDFEGTATKYLVKCGDGRTILKGAFDHQNGDEVPLLWRHRHNDPDNVLGHGILVSADDKSGMRFRAKFNDTVRGKRCKQLVKSGDIRYLSIYANNLIEKDQKVAHGVIREVSLVLAAANPGAGIDNVLIHGEDEFSPPIALEGEVIIHTGIPIEIIHEDEPEDSTTTGDIYDGLDEKQKDLVSYFIMHLSKGGVPEEEGAETVGPEERQAIWDSMTEQQQKTVTYLMQEFLPEEDNSLKQSDLEGDDPMPPKDNDQQTGHRLFEENGVSQRALIHEHRKSAENLVKKAGSEGVTSLRKYIMQEANEDLGEFLQHSITNIDVLFPDATTVHPGKMPVWLSEPMAWAKKVMDAVKKTPFAYIRSMYGDMTPDEARAKGYATSAEKAEQVVAMYRRTTQPQTIYKKQKLERDNVIDITDFNVVMWIKNEMRMKLLEEIARAILIGDGRTAIDPDKIQPDNVRRIWQDDDAYVTNTTFTDTDTVLQIIDGMTLAMLNYWGSGSPVLYVAKEWLAQALVLRDPDGHRLYNGKAGLASEIGVSDIVAVPYFSTELRSDGPDDYGLIGIIVNLRDYNLGADKGGQTTLFEDFDIDFNAYKYLYETRISGALVIPKCALTFEQLQ